MKIKEYAGFKIVPELNLAFPDDDEGATAMLRELELRFTEGRHHFLALKARRDRERRSTRKDEPIKRVSKKRSPRGRTQNKPVGDNLVGLRLVAQSGEIDAGDLAEAMFEEDTKVTRSRVYQRVKFWKEKSWLVEDDDGDFVVPDELAEQISEENSDDEEE